jgi:hypothetical protein
MHGYPRGYRGVARVSWGVSTDMGEQMKQRSKALQRHAAQLDRAATRVRGPEA